MLFNSYVFVLLFLPLVLLTWWSLASLPRLRLSLLVLASFTFYGWWDWRFVGLLMVSTVVDYCAGQMIAAGKRHTGLLVSVFANMGLLVVFKYTGMLASTWNAWQAWLTWGTPIPVPDIILPAGISFYTFQTMSYSIDLYRGVAQPASSFLHFAAYVSLFPQLIAGPIVRYADVEDELRHLATRPDWTAFASGILFFVAGLCQKVLLADTIAERINPLLMEHELLQLGTAWFAMLGYACQLYFDFAGYSNMAVGLGLMLGFHFPQNFDSPYQAVNISDFWRRWHMTLSFWLRDYLFIPLGGNRHGHILTLRNLMLVMFLGGLWHGANWTFALWGLYHGSLLVIHNVWRRTSPVSWPAWLARPMTFLAVLVGWVLFRSQGLGMAGHVLGAMIGLHGMESHLLDAVGGVSGPLILVSLMVIVFFVPNIWHWKLRLHWPLSLAAAFLLWLCILRFDQESPFLYFQF